MVLAVFVLPFDFCYCDGVSCLLLVIVFLYWCYVGIYRLGSLYLRVFSIRLIDVFVVVVACQICQGCLIWDICGLLCWVGVWAAVSRIKVLC